METTFSELLKAYGLFALILTPFIAGFFLIIRQVGKQNAKNAKEYDKFYARIEKEIETACSHEDSDAIRFDIKKLKSLKYQNDEKTDVLARKFLRCLKRLYGISQEDEFSPEQLDTERIIMELKIANEARLY
jgi:hypothetical protein